MAQIKEIKKRIKSIESTKKVTHAMELVAAAKMRRAQRSALSGRPYAVNLNQIIEEVRQKTDETTHTMLQKKESPKQLIILVTSDRGLAGGLNINLFRDILARDIKNAVYVTIGKKASNFVTKSSSEAIASFESEQMSTLEIARTVSKLATDAFVNSEVNKVSILYPYFENTTNQVPKWVKILPIEFEESNQSGPHSQSASKTIDKIHSGSESLETSSLLFEPNARQILDNILPHYVLTQIYQVLLEAKASEHSARMVAMKNATDAAGDLVDDLTLTYNQVRQETITKELLDIVTAQKAFD